MNTTHQTNLLRTAGRSVSVMIALTALSSALAQSPADAFVTRFLNAHKSLWGRA